MKYLFIDSATANLVVAIIDNNKIKYQFNENVSKDMSKIIMPILNEAFILSEIKPNQIDKIFASTGPGSFTGIRVGLTVAKTMAWALKIPVIPISSLEIIASTNTNTNNIALIDARRGYVYAGGYDNKLNNFYKDRHILQKDIKEKATFISYDNLNTIKPKIDILKIINKHKDDKPINPHKLNPTYFKKTEAEEKLNH